MVIWVSAQSATWSISMRAGEVHPSIEHSPAENHSNAVCCSTVGLRPRWTTLSISVPFVVDGGDEGVAVDHPPRVGHRDRALPGDLAHLTRRELTAVEGGEVDPHDHLGERPVLDHLAVGAAASVAGGAGSLRAARSKIRTERVGGVGLDRLTLTGEPGPRRTPSACSPSSWATMRVCSAIGSHQPTVAHAVGVDPVEHPTGLAMPFRLLASDVSVDAAATMRAASFSVSFVDRPSTAASRLSPGIRVGRLRRADRLGLTGRHLRRPSTPRSVSGAASTVSAACNNRTASPTPMPGHVVEPVRRRTVPAPLPQIGLRHPTSRQRHPRRRQMLQPGELRHQVHRVTSTRSDQGRNHRPTPRRNRRRPRPPGPPSRTPITPRRTHTNNPIQGVRQCSRSMTSAPHFRDPTRRTIAPTTVSRVGCRAGRSAFSDDGGGRARARAGWRSARQPG